MTSARSRGRADDSRPSPALLPGRGVPGDLAANDFLGQLGIVALETGDYSGGGVLMPQNLRVTDVFLGWTSARWVSDRQQVRQQERLDLLSHLRHPVRDFRHRFVRVSQRQQLGQLVSVVAETERSARLNECTESAFE